jgi:hypothetical protein
MCVRSRTLALRGTNGPSTKRVASGSFCRCRLDRALVTAEWSSRFLLATVKHLNGATSNHCPLFLRWRESVRQRLATDDKIFRYELMWESHDHFRPFIGDTWTAEGQAMTMGQLQQKLSRVSGSLENWSRDTFAMSRGRFDNSRIGLICLELIQ